MKLKTIACEVFYREFCRAVADSTNTVDLQFTAKNAHDESDQLRQQIQTYIDETEDKYDAILLATDYAATERWVFMPEEFR